MLFQTERELLGLIMLIRRQRTFRRVNQMHPGRDGRRVLRLEMGLVANHVCSLGGGGEHTNPA